MWPGPPVLSRPGYDFLRVAVDGAEAGKICGEIGWEQRNVLIPAGTHVIRWSYGKDRNLLHGSDAGWVDQVTFTAAPPTTLVYVDWRNTAPSPDGTLARPYPTLPQGLAALVSNGTMKVRAGSYGSSSRLLTKPMLLESYDGPVLVSATSSGTSPAMPVTAVRLSAPTRQADGSMKFQFSTVQGVRYQVLTSTNLVTWEVWKDLAAESGTVEFVHPDAIKEPYRFFRVIVP